MFDRKSGRRVPKMCTFKDNTHILMWGLPCLFQRFIVVCCTVVLACIWKKYHNAQIKYSFRVMCGIQFSLTIDAYRSSKYACLSTLGVGEQSKWMMVGLMKLGLCNLTWFHSISLETHIEIRLYKDQQYPMLIYKTYHHPFTLFPGV